MTVEELIDLLIAAHKAGSTDEVIAVTPHGSYVFDIDEVDASLRRNRVVLRLKEVDA